MNDWRVSSHWRVSIHPRFNRLASAAITALVAAGFTVSAPGARAQERPRACDDVDGYHELDFWVGEWDVYVGDRQVGTNRIEKILNGCAIMEHWTSSAGEQGKSLFYYNPMTDRWRQVWVTGRSTAIGGVKEKELIERPGDNSLRFQGTIRLPDGGSYLDRTTLIPLANGRTRQVIETSSDGGATWETRFDAIYVSRDGSARTR